jgi:hypothetical protein
MMRFVGAICLDARLWICLHNSAGPQPAADPLQAWEGFSTGDRFINGDWCTE